MKRYLVVFSVIVLVVLALFFTVFATHYSNVQELSQDNTGVCRTNNANLLQSNYGMMGNRMPGMMTGRFNDGQIYTNGRPYSYMGNWNMFDMHRLMWNGMMNHYNYRIGPPMMNQGNTPMWYHYSFFVECGSENMFFPANR